MKAVITTINQPNPRLTDWIEIVDELVVVGDLKTPHSSWQNFVSQNPQVTYLSPEEQGSRFPDLSRSIGWNTYARKNLGYAYLLGLGEYEFFETDDDTFPRSQLREALSRIQGERIKCLKVEARESSIEWWNPYDYFAPNLNIWPRGFPLEQIGASKTWDYVPIEAPRPQHVQFLVNNEPDLDAIFRLTREQLEFDFGQSPTFLSLGPIRTPGNTQATFTRGVGAAAYFPRTCSLRVADILRSYWLQALHGITYGGFLVEQIRNPHDYLDDFRLELDLYLNANRLFELILEASSGGMTAILLALISEGVLADEEAEIFVDFASLFAEDSA